MLRAVDLDVVHGAPRRSMMLLLKSHRWSHDQVQTLIILTETQTRSHARLAHTVQSVMLDRPFSDPRLMQTIEAALWKMRMHKK